MTTPQTVTQTAPAATGEVAIQIIGWVVPSPLDWPDWADSWIVDYDHGSNDWPYVPTTGLTVTLDRAQARRFASHKEAHEFWTQIHGVRPDGAPNRPLTALSVVMKKV